MRNQVMWLQMRREVCSMLLPQLVEGGGRKLWGNERWTVPYIFFYRQIHKQKNGGYFTPQCKFQFPNGRQGGDAYEHYGNSYLFTIKKAKENISEEAVQCWLNQNKTYPKQKALLFNLWVLSKVNYWMQPIPGL